jgi:aspartyl-tRNA(Asn)/glutamyl-tRNA(Gln) amidotransferase subunit B
VQIVEDEGLAQVSDDLALQGAIDKIMAANPDEVASFRGGKEGLFGWFMGQVMRETRGQADPQLTRELLQKSLRGEG